MRQNFSWTTFNVSDILPENWQQDIATVAAKADFREFPRTPILSREADHVTHIRRGRVHADAVQLGLPWLYKLYRNEFLEMAQDTHREPVTGAVDDRYGIVLNVQQGNDMRFECHVDSNPLTGLLFFTDHPHGGGELVVSSNEKAIGVEGIERGGSVIMPQAGYLIFFDGKTHPHYARVLLEASDIRVVAVMNFYTASCPEWTRPPELNKHLFGKAEVKAIAPTAAKA